MSRDLQGVPLLEFEPVIYDALCRYQDVTDGQLVLDPGSARILQPTRLKPNASRSETEVRWNVGGDSMPVIGKLFVIAFGTTPGNNATGDESSYKLSDLARQHGVPNITGAVPRNKSAVASEVHFTIASRAPEVRNADVRPFAGMLTVLGLDYSNDRPTVVRLGRVGQDPETYQQIQTGQAQAEPTVTFTTTTVTAVQPIDMSERRIGDPHAILLETNELQVAAFLGLAANVPQRHAIVRALGAVVPDFRQVRGQPK